MDSVRRRREHAREAAVLLQPLLPERPGGSGAVAVAREELLEVLSGRRELDDDLRTRALRAIDTLLAGVLREHLDTALAAELSALGHDASGFAVATGAEGTLRVTMAGRVRHELRLAVRPDDSAPGQSRLTWATVRTADGDEAGSGTTAEDESACADACAVLDRLTGRLVRRGAEHEEERRSRPGGAVPVDPRVEESRRRAAQERRRAQASRERYRERPP
jgi:hypothetical protein